MSTTPTCFDVERIGKVAHLRLNRPDAYNSMTREFWSELPEAVRDSTLYRMLFLAALALFVMTFVINTIAEIVRQRYRKRSAQL